MNINAKVIENVIFPLMEQVKGNNIRKNLSCLRNTQYLPKEKINELQKEKLRGLLHYCIENVPAYAGYQHLTSLMDEDPFKALNEFPTLSKQDFNSSKENYLSKGIDENCIIPNKTGGSTGEPVKFYLDRKTVEFYEAARWRGLSWWDINIGDRSVMIWGSPLELSKNKQASYKLKERFLKNRIIIPAYDLNPLSIDSYVSMIQDFKPQYIYGYASALHLFSQMVMKNNLAISLKLKGIVSTSETLYDFQREDIEKVFGCRTINEYGARDGGIIAFQCGDGQMHISAENAVIQIVDIKTKKPVTPGMSGSIIITDLNNYVMPRLRYQVGDVGVLSEKKCGCGINLPVLEKIQGREDDTFISLSGSYIHGHFFNHIARNIDGIKQFQIIQHSCDAVTLKIVKNDIYNDSQLKHFKSEILKAMGPVNLNTEFADSIPLSASGKIRYAVREFPLIM
jgi:phenylacetate-CoA ligase